MDFVVRLPKTARKSDCAFVAVDRFSKAAHFIPSRKTPYASHVAVLLFEKVARLHDIPRSFTSDGRTKLSFLKVTYSKLATKVQFNSAHHPLTEVVNRGHKNLLRCSAGNQPTQQELMIP